MNTNEKYATVEVKGIISPEMQHKVENTAKKVENKEPVTEQEEITNRDITGGKQQSELSFKEKWRIRLKAAGRFIIKAAIAAAPAVTIAGILLSFCPIPGFSIATGLITKVGLVTTLVDGFQKIGSTLKEGGLILNPKALKAGAWGK